MKTLIEVLEDLKRELHAKGFIEAMDIVYDKITLLNKQSNQQSDAVEWENVINEMRQYFVEEQIEWLKENYNSPTKKEKI